MSPRRTNFNAVSILAASKHFSNPSLKRVSRRLGKPITCPKRSSKLRSTGVIFTFLSICSSPNLPLLEPKTLERRRARLFCRRNVESLWISIPIRPPSTGVRDRSILFVRPRHNKQIISRPAIRFNDFRKVSVALRFVVPAGIKRVSSLVRPRQNEMKNAETLCQRASRR